jgi:HK97 gp10 family phage protein
MSTSSSGIEVDGLAAFQSSTDAAARQLDGLTDAHKKAGDRLATAARPRTPRQTGALAAGVRSDAASGLTILADPIDYAPFVHYGTADQDAQPWLAETMRDQTDDITDLFVGEVDQIVHQIHGT